MAAMRTVVTNGAGEVLHDGTVLLSPNPEVAIIEYDFSVLGRPLTIRYEFDPPLIVPEPTPDDATK